MNEEELRTQIRDEEHLRLLSLGYKVSAGFIAFYSLFGLFYVFMGLLFAFAPFPEGGGGASEAPLAFFGLFMGGIGIVFLLVGFTFAALRWRTAWSLDKRRSIVFCQLVAALTCLEIPYGTLLGILTFIVLARPSVRRLFDIEPS